MLLDTPESNALESPLDLDSLSPVELYEKLRELDPVMAERWHMNDVRRVRRSIQVRLLQY